LHSIVSLCFALISQRANRLPIVFFLRR
jgi:hypothetical protein